MVPHVTARKTHQQLSKFSLVTPKRLLQQYLPEAEIPLSLVASWGMPVGMSFGQPGFPQSLLVSRQVFSTSIGAKHVFEIRNTQRGI
jgi:hypothetical protein